MKDKHYQNLTQADKDSLTTMGLTSGIKDGKKVPQKCLLTKMFEDAPALPRGTKQ